MDGRGLEPYMNYTDSEQVKKLKIELDYTREAAAREIEKRDNEIKELKETIINMGKRFFYQEPFTARDTLLHRSMIETANFWASRPANNPAAPSGNAGHYETKRGTNDETGEKDNQAGS